MWSSFRVRIAICLLTLGFAALSCSRGKPVPVHPVHGRVLLDGKPLAEALVTFHSDSSTASGSGEATSASDLPHNFTATTNAEGRFQLTTRQIGDGAPAGKYRVTVELRELIQEGDEKVRGGRNLLPVGYADPQQSGLECEIRAGQNELATWELKSR